ncbi:MAG: RrF2 family transcriptional regulator [Leptospirales bacterium]
MILKGPVEWGLHCCAVLSGLPEGQYLSTRDLAEFHGIPKEYLSKAMQSLSQASLVATSIGPRGGYRLARAPDQITLLEIVEAIEGKHSTFMCTEIRKNNPCITSNNPDSKPCAIARVMWEADEAWRDRLKRERLSDILETVKQDVPGELLRKNQEWISSRTQ